MRLSALAAVLAASLGLAAPGSTARASFAFGRTGGNIEPYTVRIGANGKIVAMGPVTVKNADARLSSVTLLHLLAVSDRERFFALPRRITCAGSLPDFAAAFVTVSTARRTRTVVVRGRCSARFDAVLRALERAAGVPSARR